MGKKRGRVGEGWGGSGSVDIRHTPPVFPQWSVCNEKKFILKNLNNGFKPWKTPDYAIKIFKKLKIDFDDGSELSKYVETGNDKEEKKILICQAILYNDFIMTKEDIKKF